MSSSSQSSSHRISTVQSLRPEMSGLHLIVKVDFDFYHSYVYPFQSVNAGF